MQQTQKLYNYNKYSRKTGIREASPDNGEIWILEVQAPVVQTLDSPIHWINLYPLDNSIGFASVYPLDSDLSAGQRYPSFEQLGPDNQGWMVIHFGVCSHGYLRFPFL